MKEVTADEFARAKTLAADALRSASIMLSSGPDGHIGIWLIDTIAEVEHAIMQATRFREVAADAMSHSLRTIAIESPTP